MVEIRKPLRVIQYGVGAMGSLMIQIIQSRDNIELVGAIDNDPSKIGKDAGLIAGLLEPLGILIKYPPKEVLKHTAADIVLLATSAFIDDSMPQISEVMDFGLNIITITQELVYPIGKNKVLANQIHSQALKHNVSISAIGINPGFIMDLIPIVCSSPCWEIKKIDVSRNVDFSPYGPDEMAHIGVGLSKEMFEKGVETGKIGHIGLLETANCVADTLGFNISRYIQKKIPLITDYNRNSTFSSIPSQTVYGFIQTVEGYINNESVLNFKMKGVVAPNSLEKEELGDHTKIIGIPNLDINIKREISQKGGIGTAAMVINLIPRVLEARSGFHIFTNLKYSHFWKKL